MNDTLPPKNVGPASVHGSIDLPGRAIARALEGIAVVDARPCGKIGFATTKAVSLLAKFFGLAARNHLPEMLLKWAKWPERNGAGSRRPFSIRNGPEELFVRLSGRQDGAFQFVLEEKTDDASRLQALGLTRREAEVLLWIARGKTSREIAAILSCRTATVSKHIQRILSKLGVETRTAAAAVAAEFGV